MPVTKKKTEDETTKPQQTRTTPPISLTAVPKRTNHPSQEAARMQKAREAAQAAEAASRSREAAKQPKARDDQKLPVQAQKSKEVTKAPYGKENEAAGRQKTPAPAESAATGQSKKGGTEAAVTSQPKKEDAEAAAKAKEAAKQKAQPGQQAKTAPKLPPKEVETAKPQTQAEAPKTQKAQEPAKTAAPKAEAAKNQKAAKQPSIPETVERGIAPPLQMPEEETPIQRGQGAEVVIRIKPAAEVPKEEKKPAQPPPGNVMTYRYEVNVTLSPTSKGTYVITTTVPPGELGDMRNPARSLQELARRDPNAKVVLRTPAGDLTSVPVEGGGSVAIDLASLMASVNVARLYGQPVKFTKMA